MRKLEYRGYLFYAEFGVLNAEMKIGNQETRSKRKTILLDLKM